MKGVTDSGNDMNWKRLIRYDVLCVQVTKKWNDMTWHDMTWIEMIIKDKWNKLKGWQARTWIEMKWNDTQNGQHWFAMLWNEMKWVTDLWNEMKWAKKRRAKEWIWSERCGKKRKSRCKCTIVQRTEANRGGWNAQLALFFCFLFFFPLFYF